MGHDSEAWRATGKDERREYGKDWGGRVFVEETETGSHAKFTNSSPQDEDYWELSLLDGLETAAQCHISGTSLKACTREV